MVDYAALAAKAGGTPAPAAGVDYAAIAAKSGGKPVVVAPPAPAPAPSYNPVDTLKGKVTFPAKTDTSNPIGNIARTFGNIPSDAAGLTRAVIAPVNPLDTDSPINVGSNLVKGFDAAKEIIKNRGLIEGAKDVAGGLADTATKIFKAPGEKIVGEAMKLGADPIGYAAHAAELAAKLGIEHPLLVPSLIYGPKNAAGQDGISRAASVVTRDADTSFSALGGALKKKVVDTAESLTAQSEKQLTSSILDRFKRGIKPPLGSNATANKVAKYDQDIVSAVKTIKENKGNLKFTDDLGNLIEGQAPESLQQFSDAVEQTKKSIFGKYDALSKEAGEAGVKIDVAPIGDQLDTVINNKALALTNPKAVAYATELKQRLAATGRLDASTAQDVIQNYNKSLEAFYRNPTYDNASHAAIDSMVANNMREALDSGITGLTGQEYGALKAQYGALKTIEKDVIKASLRDARKNTKGLIDFTDIFSGGQVVNGIISLNPATISQGLAAKAISAFYKHLNDPNRAIRLLFQEADKLPVSKVVPRTPFLELPAADASKTYLNNGMPIKAFPASSGEYVGPDVAVKTTLPTPKPGTETVFPQKLALPAPGQSPIQLPERAVPPPIDQAGADAAYARSIQGKNEPNQSLLPTAPSASMTATPNTNPIGAGIPSVANSVKGGDSALQAVDRHLNEARQVLKELPKELIEKEGGIGALLDHTKTNIVDGLRAEGMVEAADAISHISAETFTTLDDFAKAIASLFAK